MPDNENTFDFGTGSIDRNQWLRDIDNGQEEFISMYGNVANKHRTALLRQAFQDLRRRIANGDMLNRTADGQYQFSSALNREDKHMQEAYQRALGFMGNLARTQIKAPTPLEEKKYGTATLQQNWLKYLNPSGEFNSKSYWEGDDANRIAELKNFLKREKDGLGVYTGYEDYKDRTDLESRIDAFISNPTEKNLQRLGFKGQNWITKPVEEAAEEQSKTEEQLLNQQLADLQTQESLRQKRALLDRTRNRGLNTLAFGSHPTYDLLSAFNNFKYPNGVPQSNLLTSPWNSNPTNLSQTSDSDIQAFIGSETTDLDNYFNNFGVNYRSLYNKDASNLAYMLSRLTASRPKTESNPNSIPEFSNAFNRYLTPIGNGNYIINGSNTTNGRFAIYVPNGPQAGIQEMNIEDLPDEEKAAYNSYFHFYKNGGSIKKLQDGGITDSQREFYGIRTTPIQQSNNSQNTNQESATYNNDKSVSDMDVMDWTNILGPAILDLTSMLSANIPGYGTIASAGTGIASTLWSGIQEWQRAGAGSGLTTIGGGLLADTLGLIPGWGSAAKLGKIAKGLSKYAKYIGPAMATKGLTDAAGIFNKWMTQGSDSLTQDDINVLVHGLIGLTSKGTAGVKRANRTNLERAATTQYKVRSRNGNTVVLNADQLAKLRAQGKVRTSRPIITQESLMDANGEIMNASKWPIFGSITSENRMQKMLDFTSISRRNQGRSGYHKRDPKTKAWEFIPAYKPVGTTSWDLGVNIKLPTKENSLNKFNAFREKFQKAKAEKEQYGGVLKALRNGGIIKAQAGTEFPGLTTSYKTFSDWGNLNWGTENNLSFKGYMTAGKDKRNGITWSKGLYANDQGDQNMESAYFAQQNYYDLDNGANIMGDVKKYYDTWIQSNAGKDINAFIQDYNSKVDELRNLNKTKTSSKANSTGWTRFNELHHLLYPSYGLQGDGSDDWSDKLKDILGESTWRRVPNTFKSIGELQDKRSAMLVSNDPRWQVAMDNQGHLITNATVNPEDDVKETSDKSSNSVDSLADIQTNINKTPKNPWDPTLLITAGKTALGLLGNRNIYGNLLDEMPQAPLRDSIDRKLAIVGWQEKIKQGQNELADLRRVQQRQQGADQQTNFATALETERVGRDIMDKAFVEDSGRQFETAGKSWNLDNEDYLYNAKVGDDNRKAIADRARMMAQIRAAWRSGDNNILMGALADTGNWWLKKYQREQDLVDKAKELELGTPEEWAQSEYTSRLGELANKKASELTAAEEAKVKAVKAQVLREMRKKFSEKYYNTYHNPMFGVGYNYSLVAKDGTKLEVAKLRARSKDNDRYVSMVKDLRKRRRRR